MIKIKCGKLYDGLVDKFQENMEILVDGKYIKEVGHNLACPEGTEIIDLSDLTVTPGLIDAHIHPQFVDWHDLYHDMVYYSEGYRTLCVYRTAEKVLHRGFTTMRSIGWPAESHELDVKRMINEGNLPGARLVVAAHTIGTTGCHGDIIQSVNLNPRLMDYLSSIYPTFGDGADFFIHAVRREKNLGADFLKIMATGGFGSPVDSVEDIQLNDDEMKAIFGTAQELDIPTTAHVYAPRTMKKLMHYGITGMEHGSLMDEETAHMAEETGTYLVPTFCPYTDAILGDEESMGMKMKHFNSKLHKYQDRLREGRKIILGSNIKLGYGTDIVSNHHNYDCGWEYSSWLLSGADPFRALKAATKTNAEICRLDKVLGTIEPGKYADISGWGRDLLTDIDALRDCAFVMKEGIRYSTESQVEEDKREEEEARRKAEAEA